MEFVEEEDTRSSFRGVAAVIRAHGLFSAFYSDRGSHYGFTPKVGGKVDKRSPTQFGRALGQLGIEMIAAYSPQARGRSERAFRTHQDRLPKELALAGITTMAAANRYLRKHSSPPSTPSSRNRRWRPAPPSYRGWVRTWRRSSAGTSSARSGPITACPSRAASSRFRPSAIAAIC